MKQPKERISNLLEIFLRVIPLLFYALLRYIDRRWDTEGIFELLVYSKHYSATKMNQTKISIIGTLNIRGKTAIHGSNSKANAFLKRFSNNEIFQLVAHL